MALTKKYQNPPRTSLMCIILFLLVFMNKLTSIYVFSQMALLGTVVNVIQIPLYCGLISSIVKKSYTLKELFSFFLVGALLLIGYIISGQAAYFRGFLLILAVRDVPYRKVLNVCRKALTLVLGMGLLLFFVRVSDAGIQRRGASGFGFVHPNITAQLIMIILLLWVSERTKKLDIIHWVYVELIGVMTYALTGSKTSTIVICLIPFVLWLSRNILSCRWYDQIAKTLMMYSQLLIMLFTYVSAKYLETSNILKTLDLVFTNRLFLNYYVFNKYGIKAFGQNVTLSDYSGTIYNNIHGWGNWSVTCDCSYMATLLVMGLVPTMIVLVGYVFLMRKAIRQKNYIVMSIALLLSIYSFCESQMLEVYSTFVYFYLTAEDVPWMPLRNGIIWSEKCKSNELLIKRENLLHCR